MKTIILTVLVLLTLKCYAQTNVYTFNDGKYIKEDNVKALLDISKKKLPPTYDLTAVIYHKILKRDTIINYITFSASKKISASQLAAYKFEYKQDSTYLLLNQKLPVFKLTDLDGNEISSDDLLGKPTLINFWATYCGPCIAEMPQLSKLKERYKDKMNFISITENSTTGDQLQNFLKNKDFNFQVLQSAEFYKRKLKIEAIPKNLFLDKNGILRYIQGNYPEDMQSKALPMDDKNNYFTKIIDELVNNSK